MALTTFQKDMANRLRYLLDDDALSYETAVFINGCAQYGVEDDMMEFSKANPAASLEELWAHFDSITPLVAYTDDEDDE